MIVRMVSDQKIAETASKGTQEKWLDGDVWYKLDQYGYEALVEVFASQLLEYSNIETDFPFTFVRYRMERLQVHGQEQTGCSSRNFLQKRESLLTLSHLFLLYTGKPLSAILNRLTSDKKRIAYLAEETASITGLSQFPQYLTLLFEIDGLLLNDDRNLNNIAVLAKDGIFDYCPIFDQGAGLLSNRMRNSLKIAPASLISQAKAQPLKIAFDHQIRTIENLYGKQLKIPSFTREQLAQMVGPLLEYYPARDRDLIADRVCETIMERQACR